MTSRCAWLSFRPAPRSSTGHFRGSGTFARHGSRAGRRWGDQRGRLFAPLLGYSVPMDTTVDLAELREHLFTDPATRRRAVPHLVLGRALGTCASQRVVDGLVEGECRVKDDVTLDPGTSRTAGSCSTAGRTDVSPRPRRCATPRSRTTTARGRPPLGLARILAAQDNLRHSFRLRLEPGHDRAALLAPKRIREARRARASRVRGVVRG